MTRLWDASTGRELAILPSMYARVAFSPDSTRLTTRCLETLKVFEIAEILAGNKRFGKGLRRDVSVISTAWAPDSQRVVVGDRGSKLSRNKLAEVWNVIKGELEFSLNREGEVTNAVSVDWSRDGALIAVAVLFPDPQRKPNEYPGAIRIWDAERQREIRELRLFDDQQTKAIQFSPGGSRYAPTLTTVHRKEQIT